MQVSFCLHLNSPQSVSWPFLFSPKCPADAKVFGLSVDIQLWEKRLRVCHSWEEIAIKKMRERGRSRVISFEVYRVMPITIFLQIRFQQQKAQIRTEVWFTEQRWTENWKMNWGRGIIQFSGVWLKAVLHYKWLLQVESNLVATAWHNLHTMSTIRINTPGIPKQCSVSTYSYAGWEYYGQDCAGNAVRICVAEIYLCKSFEEHLKPRHCGRMPTTPAAGI